jgi:N-methylhydantoinase B/oxoprolinase/acetone carboxylase alpha subunit
MIVDLETLQKAHRKVAALVVRNQAYVPIFERLEREIAMLEAEGDVISRARAVSAHYKAVA